MKKCPRCGHLASPQTMVCRCGHSFTARAEPLRPGGRLPGDLGCFIWLFVVNALWAGVLAALCFWPDAMGKRFDGAVGFGWFFTLNAVVNVVEIIGLSRRRRFAYNLGMVICWTSFFNLPVGTIMTIILMTGLAKQRQWLTR